MIQKVLPIIFLLFSFKIFSQSDNFKAQGEFYAAKSDYENKNYSEAFEHLVKARKLLDGSNIDVQYLAVLIPYEDKKYIVAQREMQRFFAIYEKREKTVPFSVGVEQLSKYEITDISKIMVEINDRAQEEIETRENKDRLNQMRKLKMDITKRYDFIHDSIQKLEHFSISTDTLNLTSFFQQSSTGVFQHPNKRSDNPRVKSLVLENGILTLQVEMVKVRGFKRNRGQLPVECPLSTYSFMDTRSSYVLQDEHQETISSAVNSSFRPNPGSADDGILTIQFENVDFSQKFMYVNCDPSFRCFDAAVHESYPFRFFLNIKEYTINQLVYFRSKP